MDSPFVVEAWTRRGSEIRWAGRVGNPIAITSVFRDNAVSSVEIRLAPDDKMNQILMEDAAFCRVFYRGKLEMTGKIRTRQGSFLDTGDRVYQVRDHRAVLDDVLALVRPMWLYGDSGSGGGAGEAAWPFTSLPANANSFGQWNGGANIVAGDLTGASGYFNWAQNMPAWLETPSLNGLPPDTETAMLKLFILNLARISGGAVFKPLLQSALGWQNLHRGKSFVSASQLPQVRFGKLSDVFKVLADEAGLSVRVLRGGEKIGRQTGTVDDPQDFDPSSYRLAFRERNVWPADLTAEAGIIVEPSTWTLSDPIATRVYAGGPGELAQRLLYKLEDIATEERVGWASEVFRDATSNQPEWPDGFAENLKAAVFFLARPEISAGAKAQMLAFLEDAARRGMAEGSATSGLSLTLAETKAFHYGGEHGVQLGDLVTARKGPATNPVIRLSDRINEVAVSWTREGVRVTPKVGNRVDDPNRRVYEAISKLAASQRRLSADK